MKTDEIKIKTKRFDPFLVCETDGRSIFGRTVIAKIRERGMTQDELRLKAGVAASTLSRIINGKRTPSWNFVNDIARALDTTAIELMAHEIPFEVLVCIVKNNVVRYSLPQRKALSDSVWENKGSLFFIEEKRELSDD